jgi:hypothetical protein
MAGAHAHEQSLNINHQCQLANASIPSFTGPLHALHRLFAAENQRLRLLQRASMNLIKTY